MTQTHFNAQLRPAAPFIFVLVVLLCLTTESLLAQSSSRVDILPSVSPMQAQPTYAPYTQPQAGVPVQGSTTRGMPVMEGQVIGGGPIVNGLGPGSAMPVQSTPIYGSNVGSVLSGSVTRGMTPPQVSTFESKFWNYLVRSKYRNWAPVPGKSDGAYEGQSPHGAYLKMFLNRKAAGNPTSLPDGSILIKENYTAEQALAAITVMYKTAGYNAKSADWYWVKYNPDGTVASKSTDNGSVRLAGRVKGCIECHSDADGNDFVFFND